MPIRRFVAAMLLFIAGNLHVAIDADISGSWYDPAESGQEFTVQCPDSSIMPPTGV